MQATYKEELHARHISTPGFKEFYDADTVEPKDEKLNFADFKTLVKTLYPDKLDDTFKAAFDMATNTGEMIDFN